MFELTVQGEFCAAHALVIHGQREPVHGHNWRVRVTVAGPALDADGLLCDFHAIERALREVTGRLDNRSLNDLPAFSGEEGVNPSAEHVARHIGERMAALLGPTLAPGARVARVSVTEAPGCVATWMPGGGAEGQRGKGATGPVGR